MNELQKPVLLHSKSSYYSDRRLFLGIPNIPENATWSQDGVTVAGGYGMSSVTNALNFPMGVAVDDDQTIVIADSMNDRIVEWKMGATNGQVVAGGNGLGTQLDRLYGPIDVLIDKEMDSLIICEANNRRVVQWSRRSGTKEGELLIGNIHCCGLAMDDQRYLYIVDEGKYEVRRYKMGDKNGTVVAGGNGKGDDMNQLGGPTFIFVDQNYSIYISDQENDRVMKWNKDATEGIVVAGGQGRGNTLTKMNLPEGLFVDTLGTLYVVDRGNARVMRWPQGAKQGTVIVGGNGWGLGANQLRNPNGLSFDRRGNLYVADHMNHRVQRFTIN
jgi:sugar lactone lactonase YvrE